MKKIKYIILIFFVFIISVNAQEHTNVIVALNGYESSEPLIDESFIAGYESEGGQYNGTILIKEVSQVIPMLEFAKQNNYQVVIKNWQVQGYTDEDTYPYYKDGIQVVVCSGSNKYRFNKGDNFTLSNIVIVASGYIDNATSYPCEFYSQDPYGYNDKILNIVQGGTVYTISKIKRLSNTVLQFIVDSSKSEYDFEHGIPVRFSNLSGTDISPLPNGLFYLSWGRNNMFHINFNTASGTINQLQTPLSGSLKYGTKDENVFLKTEKWNLAFRGYGYSIYGVKGFENNINGIFPVDTWVNVDGFGDKIEFNYNVGQGSYEGNGRVDFSTQSYTHSYVTGQISKVKDSLQCSWWEARYRCRVTGTENGVFDTYNGFGKINIIDAINYSGFIPSDPYLKNDTLKLKLSIEGLYNVKKNIITTDSVTIKLMSSTEPNKLVDEYKGVIDNQGNIETLFTNTESNQLYYIVVNHRNSIETWSSDAIQFSNNYCEYDFTTSQSLGNNSKLINNKYSIKSGDVNQDGFIDYTDLIKIYNDLILFVKGYVVTDINNDRVVTLTDLNFLYNNIGTEIIKP